MTQGTLAMLALVLALAATGCSGNRGESPDAGDQATAQKKAEPPPSIPEETPKTEASPLMNPSSPEMTAKAPDTYKAKFEVSHGDSIKGHFVVEVTRAWSPNGADRFYNLVRNGFFDNVRFFRVVSGFMVQFGVPGDPKVGAAWANATFPDDPAHAGISNTPGMVTFAKTGQPNSRSTQVFINYGDNKFLDQQGFTPFGKVLEGMTVVTSLFAEYGDIGNVQMQIRTQGNAYLDQNYPKLDVIKKASIVQ